MSSAIMQVHRATAAHSFSPLTRTLRRRVQTFSAAPFSASYPQTPGNNAPAPVQPPPLLAPAALYQGLAMAGGAKANSSIGKTFVLSVLAGVFIGFGALLMISVGGACPGLAATNPGLKALVSGLMGLPTGLLMVLLTGSDLFTGNTALVPIAVVEGKASFGALIKNLTIAYIGNFVGSVLLAWMVAQSGILATAAAPKAVAVGKTSLPFMQAFFRGVLCNWLVCLGVVSAAGASTLPGKAIAILPPISAFIAIGLEHSVANMFLVPFGIMCGAPVTWGAFLSSNLLPVTLGNMFAGIVCVALPLALAYGKPGAPKTA